MPDTRRKRILDALIARLERITIANGFDTDAGLQLFVGEALELGPDDPVEAIAVRLGEDQPQYQGEQILCRLPLEIQAIAKADLDRAWLRTEVLLGDIKRAIELPDRTLGGLVKRQLERGPTRAMEREAGTTTVGLMVTYTAPFTEVWGHP